MSFDLVMRTLGVLTCLYTVAYFVTTMSVAALNGVSYNSGPMCGPGGCVTVASKQHTGARYAYNFGNPFSGTHFGAPRSARVDLRISSR